MDDDPGRARDLNGAVVTWPVATTVDAVKASSPSTLLWNVASTLGGTDQAIDVQAVFTDNATPTPTTWTSTNPPTVIVDRAAFGESYATDDLGPGSVSLVTGNYSVTATDVQVPGFNGDMTVRRSFNSFAPAVSGPFGPGWVLSLGVDTAGSSWSAVTDLGSFVKASEADGDALYFAVQADGTHEPFADTAAAGLTLPKAGSGTGTKYTVADTDGNSTVFAYASAPGPRPHRMRGGTGSSRWSSRGWRRPPPPTTVTGPRSGCWPRPRRGRTARMTTTRRRSSRGVGR